MRDIGAVLFDKDGTLFDFHATWSVWAFEVIRELASEGPDTMARLAEAVDYDLAVRRFRPTSPIVAGTNREAAERLCGALPGRDVAEMETYLMRRAAAAPLAPAVPLAPFLDGLLSQGLRLGVVTNDTGHGAHAHLAAAGVLERFDFVAGFDDGHGAKPAPGALLAFARAVGVAPARVVMVGDSTHDLIAGRAAGMACLGVLTGTATHGDLAACADAVLPDIGHLPGWLAA